MSTLPVKAARESEIPRLDVTRNLVILTGAGISAESGLKTFRDSGGLWEGHRVDDVATPEAFYRNPEQVHDFYNMRRRQLKTAHPNAAHCALAVLEKQWLGDFMLITQNVDDLHGRAGSRNPLHMHGELKKARCQRTDEIFDWEDDLTVEHACPCCNKAGNLRPHIVWFGEIPLELDRIGNSLSACDYFLAIGTSGIVYPAAGFSYEAKQNGAYTMEISLEPSGSDVFDLGIYGPATETVSRLVKKAR